MDAVKKFYQSLVKSPVAKNGVIALQFCALALNSRNVKDHFPVKKSGNLFVSLFVVCFWLSIRFLQCCTQARRSVYSSAETR